MQDELDAYIRYLAAERNASPHTVSNYRREIGEFKTFAHSHRIANWTDVEPPLIRSWMADLHTRSIARASVARRLSELRAFYTYMKTRGLVASNPVQYVKAPKLPQRLPRPLPEEDIRKLLEAIDQAGAQGMRDLAMLELLYAGGLRVSELIALDLADVDLSERRVSVTGKGAKERVALIGAPAVAALTRYLDHARPVLLSSAERSGGQVQGGKWVSRHPTALFLNRFGQRLSVSMFTRSLSDHAAAAGLGQRVTPHMLRHSFATHMLDHGADLRSVQELLGHERASTTQIYTQVSQRQLRETVLKAHPRARLAKTEEES